MREVKDQLFARIRRADPDHLGRVDDGVYRGGRNLAQLPGHEKGVKNLLFCRFLDFLKVQAAGEHDEVEEGDAEPYLKDHYAALAFVSGEEVQEIRRVLVEMSFRGQFVQKGCVTNMRFTRERLCPHQVLLGAEICHVDDVQRTL